MFQVCGCIGLGLAILLDMSLVNYRGLSPLVIWGIMFSAVLTFIAVIMVTKVITGEEQIIYYHHEIAVMLVAALFLWLLGQPILPYLDLTILGIGTFLACGRIGCLMVGCCHGRPSPVGVRYREEHAAAGFTPYYVGVRLFPVQVVESVWVLSIVLVGTAFFLEGYPAGTALAWYVVTYDLGRFCLEFLRGDPERPYLWGFSQGQWISILLMCLVVWAEYSGSLPFQSWHTAVTIGLVLVMIAVALWRRFQKIDKHRLVHPHHVREVAGVIELTSNLATEPPPIGQWTVMPRQDAMSIRVPIGCTSLGVQISASKIRNAAGCVYHYALSHKHGGMTEDTARIVARLILQLKQAAGSSEFLNGNQGVFHLLIKPGPERN